jgi:hypothetical protein
MEPQPMTKIDSVVEEVKDAVAEPLLQYSCRKCRRVLFTEDNLEEHMSKVKGYNTKNNSLKVDTRISC